MSWLVWVRRAVLAVIGFAVLLVGVTGFRVWYEARQDHRPASDAIVVLGTAQYDGRPSDVFAARLDHAARLYQDGVAPRIVVLGGNQPGDRTTEGAAGASYLTEHGIDGEAVIAVEEGSNTLNSLEAAEELFADRGWESAVLVTDPWHALRAGTMARDLGLDAVVSPTRSGPIVQSRETQARYIWRETWAHLYYSLFGSTPDAVSSR